MKVQMKIRMNLLRTFLFAVSLAFLGAGTARAFPVDEIRSEGVTAEQWEQAKGVTGLLPGDEYSRERAMRAEGRLQDFFESKGFPQNEVSHEVLTRGEVRTLRFLIRLGPALKLESLVLESRDPGFTPELQQKLMKTLDIRPGEPFDRDRIKDLRHSVESFLSARNFIDSRVARASSEVMTGGIRLRFELELGEQVVFSVQGNRFFSRPELMEVINKQRAIGLGRDYVTVLMDRLVEHHVAFGFRKVSITPYFFEAHGNEQKKVLFKIDEGPRIRIESVVFDGNEVFSDEELEGLFFDSAEDRIRARIYNGAMVDSAAAGLIEQIKRRGYLSARLIGIKTEERSQGAGVSIRIFLNEGLQTRVRSIEFRGNRALSNGKLVEELGIREGDPLDPTGLEDGIDRIRRSYRSLGHLEFRFVNETGEQQPLVVYAEKNQLADLVFEIEEGPVFHLAGVEILGNEITRRRVIEREITIGEGEVLSEDRIIETEDRIRRLGIFAQVTLEVREVPGRREFKILRITVQETARGNTTAGLGYRNDLGIRTFGGLSYSNLWGLNHTWSFDATINRRIQTYQNQNYRFVEYTAQVGYTIPWAFLGPTTLRPGISAEKRQYIEFDAETFAFNTNLERMLYRPLRISGIVSYTLETIRQFNAVDATQNQKITIGSITPTLRIDLRDNPLSPRQGMFSSASFEYANQFFGSQMEPLPIRYGRFQTRTDFHWNFVPSVVWFGSVRGGWLRNFVDPRSSDGSLDPRISVPLIKQFALGGINSIRGFNEQEINVQAGDSSRRVQGYLTYVNYRTQLDFYPGTSFSIGPFLDAGNLKVDDFNLGDLRFGSGVGFRYVTPAGPVNFDWGFKLFPRPGEDRNVFYFSLGII